MAVRLLHTSDWHVGKIFGFADNATAGLLQDARLRAIRRLGELARTNGVHDILVAGDVYDMEGLTLRSLNQPMERMRAFECIRWHLLPGNHDPNRRGGVWERLLQQGVPPNVHVHLDRKPEVLAGDGFALLPAPLEHGRSLEDPTAYMDAVELPDSLARVGLAHGSVTDFGFGDGSTPNLIAADRAERANLAYLALGDWHGRKRVNERCWYSGTPETDDFGTIDGGWALLVEINGPDAAPVVTPLASGEYTWCTLRDHVDSRASVDRLADTLRAMPGRHDQTLLRLRIEGTLSLEDRAYVASAIADAATAGFRFSAIDDHDLIACASSEDLDRIDRGGFVRRAAEILKRQSEDGGEHERHLARRALQRLYLEHRKLEERRQ